ncbi:MAG: hypothetical protein KGH57_01295 [Candidatus Micrarchaeota archaeon]|nr:hypothetical protein [Candidatus Micrarchaeota archaeon]
MAKGDGKSLLFIVAYVLTWLTGIIVFLAAGGNKRLKRHAVQAILIGIIMWIVAAVPLIGSILFILLWIYGLYLGYNGYLGKDIAIPVVSDYVK